MSLAGLLGIAASGVEGFELNVLGLNFGIGPNGVKLPLVGRIGSVRAGARDTRAAASGASDTSPH